MNSNIRNTDAQKNTAASPVAGDEAMINVIARELGTEASENEIKRVLRSRAQKKSLIERVKAESAKRRYDEMLLEAEEMKNLEPDFELTEELKNPRFNRCIKSGFSVFEAWQFAHFDEILREFTVSAENMGFERAVRLMREGSERPEENGCGEQVAVSGKKSAESLTGKNIRDIIRRVENGAKIKF